MKKFFTDKKPEIIATIAFVILLLLGVGSMLLSVERTDRIYEQLAVGGRGGGGNPPASLLAYATDATNRIINTGPVFLERVVVGKNLVSSSIQISDHATDSTANIIFFIEGDTLQDGYPIGANLDEGLTITTSGDISASIIYSPK